MVKALYIIIALALSLTAQGQTIDQVKAELHRQNVPHPDIVLAQARLESGNFKSSLYKRTNNPFGIKHGGRYARYSHWKDAIKDYKECISSRWKPNEDYYKFLQRIGYAEEKNYIQKLKKFK